MRRFLGVDGGGTKTHFVLIGDDGSPLAESTGPSCSAAGVGLDLMRRVLGAGIAEVTAAAGIDAAEIDHAFFALPGYGEASGDLAELDAIPGRLLGHDRYRCGNDMIAGWAGSLGGVDGVNVVAGTGSIAYGEWNGHAARVGGWSELFGDEGSGYWVAVEGLKAFSRMADGRLASSPLRDAMREAVGAAGDLDVIGVVTGEWAGSRSRIAALSRVVTSVAADGDPVAQRIVERAGSELALLAEATRRAIAAPPGQRVPLSYSGGMFTDAGVLRAFLAAVDDGWDLRAPLHGPGRGAALYARTLADRRA